MMNKKSGGILRIIDNNLFSLKFMWNNARTYLFVQLLDSLWNGLITPVSIILTSMLFNRLDMGVTFASVMTIIGAMAAIKIIAIVWAQLYERYVIIKFRQELHYKVQKQIFEKVLLM